MGTGVSLFFIAIGAILSFAVDTNTEGFNLDAVGVILMVIGLLGLVWSLIAMDSWRPMRRRNYVDDDVVVSRNDVVVDDELPARRTARRVYR